jgi:hypothetical protein
MISANDNRGDLAEGQLGEEPENHSLIVGMGRARMEKISGDQDAIDAFAHGDLDDFGEDCLMFRQPGDNQLFADVPVGRVKKSH